MVAWQHHWLNGHDFEQIQEIVVGKISRQRDVSQAFPTPSPTLPLCSVNNIADLAWLCNGYSTAPVCPLGHGLLLFCLSVSILLEDSQQLLPGENKHICSPHGSSSLLPASPVMPYLPQVQWTVGATRQQWRARKQKQPGWGLHPSSHRIVDGSLTVGNCNREEPVYSITWAFNHLSI